MKRITRIIAIVLTLASILSFSAFASTPGEGLAVFDDVADMTTYTFSDVPSSHWAFSGIKVCYDKGVLLGYQNGTYKPNNHVTWAHAITIAARIHSTYCGNTLRTDVRPGEYWYSPYYEYCQEYKLLPASCPKNVNLAGSSYIIPRYDLAYIFSRTVDASDLPAISDRQITDLASIPSAYLDSVKLLYASGVMNGWSDYSFGGTRLTTRAQIAAVISRLLEPSERIGHDSRANADMADVQANLENDSIAVKMGNLYYCLYKYNETPSDQRFAFYAVDGEDYTKELYTAPAGSILENVNAYKGKIYFCQNTPGTAEGSLICYNPADNSIETVYEGYVVDSYCFYDDSVFALCMTDYANNIADYRYAFGYLVRGGLNAIAENLSFYEVKDLQPYGWNNCIYFKLSSQDGPTNLYRYNIAADTIEKVSDVNINTSFFDGHVMYFLAYDGENNYDRNLYAMSIQAPAVIKTIGEFPATTNVRYRSLYKYGDNFYCLSSFNHNLYSMDASGKSRLVLPCGGVYGALCFAGDKAILIPNTLAVDNPNELKVYNADTMAARSLYGDWMGLSCYYEGARFTPVDGQPVFSTEESVSTVSNLTITVPEAFSRGDDFVVRTKYVNNTDTAIKLRSYVVKVYLNNTLVAYDINRMAGIELEAHGIKTYTFVIAGADVFRDFDVSDGAVSVEIIPTYDVVIEKGVDPAV